MNAKLIELSRVINESEVAFVSNLVNEFVNKHDNQKTRIGIFGISYNTQLSHTEKDPKGLIYQ
jgi:UDP-N-acetyl-D-mannosaminuronate dehydrogenase